jgi:membrane protease subunit (stomatin/prohibitin family)
MGITGLIDNIFISKENSMSAYIHLQEFSDLLWGTPAPIMAMINSQMVRLNVKGACSVVIEDVNKIEEKAPDPKKLLTQVRSILANGAIDTIIEFSRKITGVAELGAMSGKISESLQAKVSGPFSELGLRISLLEIQSIEEV